MCSKYFLCWFVCLISKYVGITFLSQAPSSFWSAQSSSSPELPPVQPLGGQTWLCKSQSGKNSTWLGSFGTWFSNPWFEYWATCLMVAVVTMDCKCKSEFISNYQLLFANSHFNSWHLDQFILFAKLTITPHSHSPCSSSHPQFECNSRTCCPRQSIKVVGGPNTHLWLSGRSDSGALRQITFWSLIRDDDQFLVLLF